jgi:hypothetical protein
MNPERLQLLLSAYLDGALNPEEKTELEEALRRSSAVRAMFWEQTLLHDQLRTVAGESRHSVALRSVCTDEVASNRAKEKPGFLAILRRPLPALAAGIVLSALCTSALWAVAGQFLAAKAKSILLLNADFEGLPSPPALGVPNQPGIWSGDYTRMVGPENGIQPRSGKSMLRFVRADNALQQQSAASYVAEAIHVVDLRPVERELQSGRAQIDIDAWFAAVEATEGRQTRFLLKAAVFEGDPAEAPSDWENASNAGLSMVQHQVDPPPTPGQWKWHTVSLSVPANARFLVFECAAMQVRPRPHTGAAEFPGHYLDDVTVRLRPNGPANPLLPQYSSR